LETSTVSGPERIAEGISLPEGPVWCSDGTVVVCAVAEGRLYRIWPETRRRELLADTSGGANGAAPATDGCFVVTQNGGMDFAKFYPGNWPTPRYTSPGLQLVRPDGKVIRLLDSMQAPNDVVVGPEGTIYFTDPAPIRDSRVMAFSHVGGVRRIAIDFKLCNGIALEPSGALVVTEDNGLMRVHMDGSKQWIVKNFSERHAVDGFCLDADGRFYLAAYLDHGIRVVEGNKVVDFLPLPGEGSTTNCCFGGPDNRWLFATDGHPGDVYVWTDLPTPGLSLYPWKVPANHLTQ